MPLNEQIAALYEDLGRARAAGVAGAGQAMGQGLAQLGQAVGQIPNQIELQKQRNDEQRARDARSALSKAMKDTPPIAQDGLNLYNVSGIGKTMTDQGFGAEFAPAAQHFDTINQSMLAFQQARVGVVKTGAAALLAAGADPSLTNDFLEHLKGNQVYAPDTIQQWQDHIKQNPAFAKSIATYLAGPQKMESAAAGSSSRNPITGEIVPGSQAPTAFSPSQTTGVVNGQVVDLASGKPIGAAIPKEPDPVGQQREQETVRHNKETERIQGLQVGRESAANAETARHNKAMEAANNPLAALTGGGASTPTSAAAAEGAHGEDFLKTLPPTVASEVKAYAEGRRPFPAGFALKSPYFQSLIQMVGQYDPTFDAVNYNARSKTRNDFTSGKSAQTINALNTVTQHLDRLSEAADALNNASIPAYNTIANLVSKATGNKQVTNFETTKKAVVDELTRAWRGAGGSEGDIKSWSQVLDSSESPSQLHGAIAEMGHLLEGKLSALQAQYAQGMGTTDTTGMQVVTPQARQVLTKLEARSGGSAAAPSLKAGDVVTVKGKRVRVTAVHPDGTFDGDEVP